MKRGDAEDERPGVDVVLPEDQGAPRHRGRRPPRAANGRGRVLLGSGFRTSTIARTAHEKVSSEGEAARAKEHEVRLRLVSQGSPDLVLPGFPGLRPCVGCTDDAQGPTLTWNGPRPGSGGKPAGLHVAVATLDSRGLCTVNVSRKG